MPASAQAASSSAVTSFASLLAGLTTPKPEADRYWNDSALADDVATISYEKALRAHARYRPAPSTPESQPAPASVSTFTNDQTLPPRKPPVSERSPERSISFGAPPTLSESRKSASVTIRLSEAECEQLHKRAEEAGLTVSAYLRSCLFEVESLRAQVKEALSQIRSAPAHAPRPVQPAATPTRTRFSWLVRLLARWRREPRLASA